jgi:hypothetical protein
MAATTPGLRRLLDDRGIRAVLLLAGWMISRVIVFVVTRVPHWYPAQDNAYELAWFPWWGEAFIRGLGDVPILEVPWEYPAGAIPIVAFPALFPSLGYPAGFFMQMLFFDAATMVLLLVWGLRTGRLEGAGLWCAAVPLMGPVVLARFDVIPTFFAAAGLIAAIVAAPIAAGVLLGIGAVVKLWPALLIPVVMTVQRRAVRVAAGASAVGLAVLVAVAAVGGLPRLLSFLNYQRDRGIEIESIIALPLLFARLAGVDEIVTGFGFGSYQIDGPGAAALQLIANLCLLAFFVFVGWLVVRARRNAVAPIDILPALGVLLMAGVLVFDKVLSAQYPIWLTGLLAVSLCSPRSPLRHTLPLFVAVLIFTQVVYPLTIQDLFAVRANAVWVLALRNALLVAFTVQVALVCRALTAAPVPAATGTIEDPSPT